MSKKATPCGTIVGEIPLNVIGPPVMIVIVPSADRSGSAFEVTTRVTVAVVGTAVGAEYRPLASIEPQLGLQEVRSGKFVVPEGVPCVSSQVTPFIVPMSLVRVALNWNCEGVEELELVGTVAVVGFKTTEIPESKVRSAVPGVAFVSAADVAVIVITSVQVVVVAVQLVPCNLVRSGRDCGAVKTTVVFVELVGMFPD